jgi:DNA helicase-2/ATP-dependent DNA helicase PcrA
MLFATCPESIAGKLAPTRASPKLGQRVRHATFGTGIVTDSEGAGAHARVQVNFEDAGSKWLVLAYANLAPA